MERNTSKNLWLSVFIIVLALAAAMGLWRYFRHRSTPAPANLPTPGTFVKEVPAGMVTYTIYVPNAQAFLEPKILAEKNPFPKNPTWEVKAGHTLELLVPRLKDLPPNTKILSIPKLLPDKVVQINLSREFSRIQSKPDTVVALMLDAFASTLGAVEANGKTLNNGRAVKMEVVIEGQSVHEFSEFDLSKPWTSTQPQSETSSGNAP